MKLEGLINEKYASLSEGELAIAKYILENKEIIHKLSINQLANNSLTSKSSVLRFAQKLGFSGFTELKNFMKWGNFFSDEQVENSNLDERIITSVTNTIEHLKNANMEELFRAIKESEHIYIIGTGWAQQNQASELQRMFLGMGKEMQVLPFGHTSLYQVMIERMCEKDLLIIFSGSGNNPLLKEALTTPILKNVKILGITASENNWLANNSTFHINAQIDAPTTDTAIYSLYSPIHVIIEVIVYNYVEFINRRI
ncbi:MurR/RpiR family transcriptional regulator [Bacillus sp. B1-b2]|uniref:MurR/RpiR family transcriptional regulator n=1 Tax=Bacillus sp. B1-b2 TaxID=2653201 RepID=UPI001261FBFD|nr:MurR/RpiR family transcriptional regulator [Bacillus sp. B1-b2]KAB7668399.1 MurR/RpiR family transcriptional regulator [Bacillus sp. B1-b2]